MKEHQNNDGYFLLEVIITLSVVTFFITGILTVTLEASSAVIKTKKRVEQIIERRNVLSAEQYGGND